MAKSIKLNNVANLTGGKKIGYAEYGKSNGYPILFFHGFPGSRYSAMDFDVQAREKNCRLIGIDRPGMGLTSQAKNPTLKSFSHMIDEFTDTLNISSFSIIAHSGGVPFALACATQLPQKINRLAIVSGIAPTTMRGSSLGLAFGLRVINCLVRNIPGVSLMLMKLHQTLISYPKIFKKSLSKFPTPDKNLLGNEKTFDSMIAASKEAFTQGALGAAKEFQLIVRNWGFELNNISCPVTIWYGRLDSQVPMSHAEIYNNNLPNAKLKVLEEDAHLSILYKHIDSIIDSAAQLQ